MKIRTMLLTSIILIAVCISACGQVETEETNQEPVSVTTQPTETQWETVPGLELYDGNVDLDESSDLEEINNLTVETNVPSETANIGMEPIKDEKKEPGSGETTSTDSMPIETQPSDSHITQKSETGAELTEYEKYMEMSGADQKVYMESFDSIEAFFNWLQNAKAEHEAANPSIEIGVDGKIDIG